MMFLLAFFVLIGVNVIPAMGLKSALPKSSQAPENKSRKNAIITLAKTGELQLDGKAVTIVDLPRYLRALQRPEERLFVIRFVFIGKRPSVFMATQCRIVTRPSHSQVTFAQCLSSLTITIILMTH
jgi:hypothetical protein